MKRFACALGLLMLVSPAFADSIDEAEAKRRGVSVEHVQLDHAKDQLAAVQAKVEALQKQVQDAAAEVAKMKTEMRKQTETAKADLAAKDVEIAKLKESLPAVPPTIAQAIKENRLLVGMTKAQADQAAGSKLIGENETGATYEYYVAQGTAWVQFRNGKVIDYTITQPLRTYTVPRAAPASGGRFFNGRERSDSGAD
jgi:seryl-tRNA synthetase